MADITSSALQATLTAFLSANYLALSGGTLTGDLNLGGNNVTSLGAGVDPGDAVNKTQLDTKLSLAGGTMTGDIAMGAHSITGLADAVNAQDAVPLAQAQGLLASFSTQEDHSASASFVVPAGITKLRARVWGAGAGGASDSSGGDGGGGGAYAEAIITVVPAETLVLTIGAAGTPSLGNGGNTSIIRGATALLLAQGGQANAGGVASSPAAITYIGFQGGHGRNGNNPGFFVWGSGGDSPQGGQGGDGGQGVGSYAGQDGIYPGGGGSSGNSGGNGAGGRIVLDY